MTPNDQRRGSTTAIPCIDLSGWRAGLEPDPALVATVAEACEAVGFLTIAGHGVPQTLIDEMYLVSNEFFSLPLEEKATCTQEGWDEYIGFAKIGAKSYKTPGPPNLVEQFHANRFDSVAEAVAAGLSPRAAAAQAPNVWPLRPAAFEATWKAYYHEMEDLAQTLGRLFAVALDLPTDAFGRYLDDHVSNLSANWYPPQLAEPLPGQVRSRTHIDFSFFTILSHDDAPGGLEVRDHEGVWHSLTATPGTYVVNLGDVMNRLTNDRWKATYHRVVNPPAEARHRGRVSIPYFVTPAYDSVIDCVPTCEGDGVRYEPIAAGEYAEQRRSGRRGLTTV
jgi:isopenicillin N synthase-like dioxygenase